MNQSNKNAKNSEKTAQKNTESHGEETLGSVTKPKKKEPSFKDIEDVVSIGALLRPMVQKAVRELKAPQLERLAKVLIETEKALADTRAPFYKRFENAQEQLKASIVFSPAFRFISDRVEETWKAVPEPTVKELSAITLIVGSLHEETQNALSSDAKKKKTA